MAKARLAELVAALSLGIDLGFAQPMEHVLRQCLISLRLAERLGLDEQERADVYYTALLINVGCHSDAHEQAKWFGDDFASKAIKYDHEPRSLRMMATGLSYLGRGHPPLHRFRLGLEFVLSGRREVDGMIESHSQIARMLGEQLGLSEAVRDALAASYERWDGRGWPGDLKGDQVPLPARISQFAEYVEVANRVGGIQSATRMARQRRGKQFDPEVVDALVQDAASILPRSDDASSWSAVVDAEPGLSVFLDDERFDRALEAIATFVDLKSPYFLGHARAVADLAAEAGAGLGLNDDEVQRLRRAGLVHNFGRLGVSNAILDKRGPLGAGEWERLRLQTYITERMLQQSEALAPLAPSALPPQLARVLAAANAYQAMREARPQREALEPDRAAAELRTGPFDAEAVEAVLGAAGHRVPRRREGPAGLTPREVEVLRLLARGLSNKEIGERLSISPKTVGNHAEHIYAKIDAQSRAAAAYFAMQQGLLPEEEFPARVAA
jgi:HD-GYP domain-containing protein (c-di-GMP phosphodiesterase class II)